MPSTKEIRTKIASIKNTQKITRAMEMVAGSKMRKAQDRQERTKAYANKIREVVGHVALSNPEYKHLYLAQRPVKRVGLIVITTDRGLCGPLNANLLRNVLSDMKRYSESDVATEICVIGNKGFNLFKRMGCNIIAHAEHLGDTPSVADLVGVVKVLLDRYETAEIDEIHLYYNRFINTMSQKPDAVRLLPLVPEDNLSLKHHWDYIYEPDARELLTALLKRYIEMQVYQAVVGNIACEQASRMVAMQNATQNAGELMNELQLVYNKARQAAITKEIAEIVGGAEAV